MLTTLKPGFFLGIDGGGTKTEAVIADASGYVLGRGFAGGANPHNVSLETAFANIQSATMQAREDAKTHGHNIQQVALGCLGLAGIDTPADRTAVAEYIHKLSPEARSLCATKLILCNDGLIALKAGTEENWGICMLSSTGSNCYGVNKTGKEAAAGDWGYLLGDQGSGFAIGLKVIRAVIAEYDGRRPKSILTDKVIAHLHLKAAPDLVNWAYHGTVPVRDIASLTQLYHDPELANSLILSQIANEAVEELIKAYRAVVHRLQFLSYPKFTVVLAGGLFNLEEHFTKKVRHAILELSPQARITVPSISAAEGAIRLAQIGGQLKLFPDSVITFVVPETSQSGPGDAVPAQNNY